MYLKVETQYDIQMSFQENSETKLSEFFQVILDINQHYLFCFYFKERLFSINGK